MPDNKTEYSSPSNRIDVADDSVAACPLFIDVKSEHAFCDSLTAPSAGRTYYSDNSECETSLISAWPIKASLWASYYYAGIILMFAAIAVTGYLGSIFNSFEVLAWLVLLPLLVLFEWSSWRETRAERFLRIVDDEWLLETRAKKAAAFTSLPPTHETGRLSVLLNTSFCLRLQISRPFYVWRDQLTTSEWRALRSRCAVETALSRLSRE